jgi:hypothetical protein
MSCRFVVVVVQRIDVLVERCLVGELTDPVDGCLAAER